MKLELTVPTLERLIGGDTEIEIAVRQQIVQAFAERHLKEVAKTATYEAAIEEVKKMTNEAAKECFDINNMADSYMPTISQRLRSMLTKAAEEEMQKAVDKAVLSVIEYQKRYWSKEIENAIKKHIDAEIERRVAEGIQARLQAALTATAKTA